MSSPAPENAVAPPLTGIGLPLRGPAPIRAEVSGSAGASRFGASRWHILREVFAPTHRDAPAQSVSGILGSAGPLGAGTVLVRCHHCGTEHRSCAQASATTCPGCGRTISFADVLISGPCCQTVDTRGNLRIERKGNLYSPLTVCGNGLILGQISGELHCEGRLTLQTRGILPVKISAEEVYIPAGAEVECPFPLSVARLIVRGTLRAAVLASQEARIHRRGICEGMIWARAMRVEQGGVLRGLVRIGPEEAPQAGQPAPRESFPQLRSALQGRFTRRRPVY